MGRMIFKITNSNQIEVLDSDFEEQDFKIISVDSDSTTIRLSTVDEDLDVIEDME
jgi:hypothetical protein